MLIAVALGLCPGCRPAPTDPDRQAVHRRLDRLADAFDRLSVALALAGQEDQEDTPPTATPRRLDVARVREIIAGRDLPVWGPGSAPVTLIYVFEASDAYSARVAPAMELLHARHAGDLRIVAAHVTRHPDAAAWAGRALCGAQAAGAYWPFFRAVLGSATTRAGEGALARSPLIELAGRSGVPASFVAAMDGPACRDRDSELAALLADAGLRSTPLVLIGDRQLSPAASIEAMEEAIAATARTR